MAGLGPFEEAPTIAVGVSGGPDSMALCMLADGWARARGGHVLALVVDHRLRPESADEARRVGGWLEGLGIDHVLLTRRGPAIPVAVHATARAARYGLMGDCCRHRGILHLLLAHHRDDQAETMLLRFERASGLDGLAAMAAITEHGAGAGVRLLRPLLGVAMADLRAVLAGQPYIDDPSNRDPAYGRTRIRRLAPILAADGVTAERLSRTAAALGHGRRILEAAVADFLAASVTIHPAGFCRLDGTAYRAAPREVAERALARMVLCIGGGAYGPRGDSLRRLHESLSRDACGRGRTLGGCRVVPEPRGVLICREPGAVAGAMALEAGCSVLWDGRFRLRAEHSGPVTVRRLDRQGWSGIPKADRDGLRGRLPAPVRPSLPALYDLDGVVAVPHLGYRRRGAKRGDDGAFTAEFKPAQRLSPAVFAFAGASG